MLCRARLCDRCQVYAAPSVDTARAILERERIDAAIVDVRLGLGGDGLELVGEIRQRWPGVRCYVLTGYSEPRTVRRASGYGVDVYEKPGGVAALMASLTAALG
jgi:two-component system response regulator YesN